MKSAADAGLKEAQGDLARSFLLGILSPKDYGEALKWSLRASSRGSVSALNYLGAIYRDGLGVPQNFQKAFVYFKQAVNKGSFSAAANLGRMYQFGEGVKTNPQEAEKLFRLAIKNNIGGLETNLANLLEDFPSLNPDEREITKLWEKAATSDKDDYAKYRFGYRLLTGIGIDQDSARGLSLLERVAGSGDHFYQYEMGRIYQDGIGVIPDKDKARSWYEKASGNGSKLAKSDLADILMAKSADPADLQRGLRLRLELASTGDRRNQYLLGNHYSDAKDYPSAYTWYSRAANQSHIPSIGKLGVLVISGLGTEKNIVQGLKFLRKAAERGGSYYLVLLGSELLKLDPQIASYRNEALLHLRNAAKQEYSYGQFILGRALINQGNGEAEIKEGFDWLRKSAESGYIHSQIELGYRLAYGQKKHRNLVEALNWYKRAAEKGNASAQYNVGLMHWNGFGTDSNKETAFEWFERSGSGGNIDGLYMTETAYRSGIGTVRNVEKAVEILKSKKFENNAVALVTLASINLNGEIANPDIVFADQQIKTAKILFDNLKGGNEVLRLFYTEMVSQLHNVRGNFSEAEKLAKESIILVSKIFGTSSPQFVAALRNLGSIFQQSGRFDEAQATFERAYSTNSELANSDSTINTLIQYDLALLYEAQGRLIVTTAT